MRKTLSALATAAGLILSTFATTAPADAQQDRHAGYLGCEYYARLASGGQMSVDAAQSLRELDELGDTSVATVAAALDVVIDANDDAGTRPSDAAVQSAEVLLVDYYGPACSILDLPGRDACTEVARLVRIGIHGPRAVDAALHLQVIDAPPSEVDAALDVIIDAEDDAGTRPDEVVVQAAYDSLREHYLPLCSAFQGPRYDTCVAAATVAAARGSAAGDGADAARELALGDAGMLPPTVGNAFDVVISANADEVAVQGSYAVIANYYAPACALFDVCSVRVEPPLCSAADVCPHAGVPEAGVVLGGAIDGAAAVIAGTATLAEVGFFASVAEADAVIDEFCAFTLAATGLTTNMLAAVGAALLATGFSLVATRRQLTGSDLDSATLLE